LFIDADARLAARPAAWSATWLMSLDSRTLPSSKLQSAVIAACSEAFEHLTAAHPQLEITFNALFHRMEVALSHLVKTHSAVWPRQNRRICLTNWRHEFHPSSSSAAFDRVSYETHDGEAVTRLTK